MSSHDVGYYFLRYRSSVRYSSSVISSSFKPHFRCINHRSIAVRGGMQIEDPCDETEHSRIVPKASNTDPLLSAGMQIKTPLQDLQGPSPDVIPLGSLCFEFKQYKK